VTAKTRFPAEVLTILRGSNGLRVRAGDDSHRFIGIWFVLVKDRLFVRSWSVKPDGWHNVFRTKPTGTIQLGSHETAVRAARIRNKTLRDAIDRAYLEKYSSPGARKYARDLGSAKSRATTLELVPLREPRAAHTRKGRKTR